MANQDCRQRRLKSKQKVCKGGWDYTSEGRKIENLGWGHVVVDVTC